jgi:Serine dehydrogenase proteinase
MKREGDSMDHQHFPKQSPLYHAVHRDRYERQALMRELEKKTGRRILVYMANLTHPDSAITREDIAPFYEIVSSLEDQCDVDLIIESPGGDPNAAETLVHTLFSKTRHLRVIVPQAAKSAATLISLAADEIVMSDTSELGPIDPQVSIPTVLGYQYRPAQAFLNGLELIKKEHANGQPLNAAYLPFLQGVDAALIDFCHKSIEHSKRLAVKWLSRSMHKNNPLKAKRIAETLINIDKYPNHGSVIGYGEAKAIGLKVVYLPAGDEFWQGMWRLYTRYLVYMREKTAVKLFESHDVSIMV